jgi:hypothetical protein
MLWIIERILERLLLKSAIQMGSQKEAEMDLKHVQSRAVLLRRAHELEEEKVPGFDALAASLRRRAEEMEGGAPGADVLQVARELGAGDDGDESESRKLGSSEMNFQRALPAPTKRKRGRPRKDAISELKSEDTSQF